MKRLFLVILLVMVVGVGFCQESGYLNLKPDYLNLNGLDWKDLDRTRKSFYILGYLNGMYANYYLMRELQQEYEIDNVLLIALKPSLDLPLEIVYHVNDYYRKQEEYYVQVWEVISMIIWRETRYRIKEYKKKIAEDQ